MYHDKLMYYLTNHIYKDLIEADFSTLPIDKEGFLGGVNVHVAREIVSPLFTTNLPVPFYFSCESDTDLGAKFDQEIVKTGYDFFEGGILRLPYPDILLVIEAKFKGGGHRLPLFIREIDEDSWLLLPVEYSRGADTEGLVNYGGYISRSSGKINYLCVCTHADDPNDKAFRDAEATKRQENLQNFFGAAIGALMTMSMPHYEQEHVQPSEKLNKKRAKVGKPPMQAYTVIKMRSEIREALEKQSREKGYTVRPHWRRGHIRHYKDGREPVAVRPCMVNWAGDGVLEKNIYKIAN